MDAPSVVIGFDLETTGPNPHEDRIVTACIGVLDTTKQDGDRWRPQTWLLKQSAPIPKEATAVHGVTTGLCNRFGADHDQAVTEIRDLLSALWAAGQLVAGHNASFDMTVLDRELARAGQKPLDVGPVFDTLVADKTVDQYRKGSRRLDACWALWGTGEAGDLHRADTDARLAAELVAPLARRLPAGLDLGGLNRFMAGKYREQTTGLAQYWSRCGKADQVAGLRYEWPIQEECVV